MDIITDYKDSPSIVDLYDYETQSPDYESFSVEKTNGKFKFVSNGGFQTRNSSTIWCIEQADAIYKWPDFKKIKIVTNDGYCKEREFAFSTEKIGDFSTTVPDFNFRHWNEANIQDYETVTKEIYDAGSNSFEIDKVGWIGSLKTNPSRVYLHELGKIFPQELDIMTNEQPYISLPDLVKRYSILIDVEGYGYSGRLKYLLFSQRPLLLVERPHKEWFFEHLKPWVHYIPVQRDLSDLLLRVKWVKENYLSASHIAKAAADYAKHNCTREASFKQWNKIISNLPV